MTIMAVVVELGLAVLAFGCGWLLGHLPLAGTDILRQPYTNHLLEVGIGAAATLPLLCLLPAVERVPWRPLVGLKKVVHESLIPLFAKTPVWQMALISLLAGFGEEIFFRAFLQSALGQWTNVWTGLLLASLVFGVCHCITPTYILLATAIGLYLGLIFMLRGNIIAPITAHALYDFIALVYLVRFSARTPPVEEATPPDA